MAGFRFWYYTTTRAGAFTNKKKRNAHMDDDTIQEIKEMCIIFSIAVIMLTVYFIIYNE